MGGALRAKALEWAVNYRATYRDRRTNYLHYGVTMGNPTRNRVGIWTVGFITKHGIEMTAPLQDIQTWGDVAEVTWEDIDKGLTRR